MAPGFADLLICMGAGSAAKSKHRFRRIYKTITHQADLRSFVQAEYETADLNLRPRVAGEGLRRARCIVKCPAKDPLISVRHCDRAKIGNE